jgi:transposase
MKLDEKHKIFIIINYSNMTLGCLAEKIGCSRQCIFYFHKRYLQRESIINQKSTGRPYKLKKKDIKRIISKLKRSASTRKDIIKDLKLDCCTNTLSKEIKKEGFRYYKIANKPKFNQSHQEARKHFCKEMLKWSQNKLNKIIFTDEVSLISYILDLNRTK